MAYFGVRCEFYSESSKFNASLLCLLRFNSHTKCAGVSFRLSPTASSLARLPKTSPINWPRRLRRIYSVAFASFSVWGICLETARYARRRIIIKLKDEHRNAGAVSAQAVHLHLDREQWSGDTCIASTPASSRSAGDSTKSCTQSRRKKQIQQHRPRKTKQKAQLGSRNRAWHEVCGSATSSE